MRGKEDERWCICGDFNAVRVAEERRGRNSVCKRREMIEFNEFISKLQLVDLPLTRRKFTWYRDNGQSCSRIDRFLLSKEWVQEWLNLMQEGLKRKESDHVAIVLKEVVKNWGPRPFKFLNCWLKEEGFRKMVEEEWKGSKINGWSGFVVKEKLKIVREKNQRLA